MHLGFTGEYQQKVDGKGRMSIPAEFRRVLEDGDPDAKAEGRSAGLYVQYGPHLQGKRLRVLTVAAHAENYRLITSIKPTNEIDRKRRDRSQYALLTLTVRLEVDKDGRVVLPVAQRERMGMTEGELVFAGIGDSFEIWPAAIYDAEVRAPLEREFAELGAGYDPMTDIYAMTG